MAAWAREKTHPIFNRAPFGITGTEIKSSYPSEGDRPRTHDARLQRHVEIAISQPFRSESRRRRADGDQLGMPGRIFVAHSAVTSARHDRPVTNNDTAHRHLAARRRATGFLEGQLHETA